MINILAVSVPMHKHIIAHVCTTSGIPDFLLISENKQVRLI